MKKSLFFGALLLIIALFVVYLRKPTPTEYITSPVKFGDVKQTVIATGTLNAINQVNVGSQVSGQLKKLAVKLGDHVLKGQFIAQIDPVLNQNTLKQTQANLDSVKAQKLAKEALLKQYKSEYIRQLNMWHQNATAKSSLETAESNMRTTEASIAELNAEIISAQVSVETARTNLGYTRIVAPISGTVIAIVTKEGQTVQASQSIPTIIKIADLDTMTVKAEISEADVVKVAPGMPVEFTILGEPEHPFHSTLRAIEPASTTESAEDSTSSSTSSSTSTSSSSSSAVYYNGLFDIPNPEHKLRVSMTTEVEITTAESKDTLIIPATAVDKLGPDSFVKILIAGKPQPRKIETGLKDGVNIEVTFGLSEGEQIILGDSESLPTPTNDGHMMPPPPGP